MEVTIKYATYDDLKACVKVEENTMESLYYLAEVWDYFMHTKGELICACHQDKIIGIGRFSVLPDKSGWLETLRVLPEYQHCGVGKRIYDEYLTLAKKYHCPSIAMYTGSLKNISSALACKYGLSHSATFQGCHLTSIHSCNKHHFKKISVENALETIFSKEVNHSNYMCMNRTFYQLNTDNITQFALDGLIFKDESSDSLIILGSRFQHEKALHILFMQGNIEDCIDFAINYAYCINIPKLSCTLEQRRIDLQENLEQRGFIKEPFTLVTLSKEF
ncbi:MAG: GNAT family N-acetyltransferase [Erysipelotrichaceae bacterium]